MFNEIWQHRFGGGTAPSLALDAAKIAHTSHWAPDQVGHFSRARGAMLRMRGSAVLSARQRLGERMTP